MSFGFSVPQVRFFWGLEVVKLEKAHSPKKIIWQNIPESDHISSVHDRETATPWEILVVVTYVLLHYCTKTSELAFSGASAWWRMESLIVQLISSGLWVLAEVGIECLNWPPFNFGLPPPGLLPTLPGWLIVFDPSDNCGACRRSCLVSSLNLRFKVVMDCVWTYKGSHWTSSWMLKGEIYIFRLEEWWRDPLTFFKIARWKDLDN